MMAEHSKIYLYRMTHIENIEHILKKGITYASSPNANPDYRPIGDHSLISTRKNFELLNGRLLGEYIPFYFGVRGPMLYVIQKGYNFVSSLAADKIVYCVISVRTVLDHNLEFIFTDGHAVDRFSTQYDEKDIDNLDDIIDWPAVRSKYWTAEKDLDLKRRKEAEFLILGDIPKSAILGFVVATEETRNKLLQMGVNTEDVVIKPNYYF